MLSLIEVPRMIAFYSNNNHLNYFKIFIKQKYLDKLCQVSKNYIELI